MTHEIKPISVTPEQQRLVALTYVYVDDQHKDETLKFGTKGPFVNHVLDVSSMMPTLFLKLGGLTHDVPESHIVKILGKAPELAREEDAIQEKLYRIGQFFERNGFPRGYVIEPGRTIDTLLAVTDGMTQRLGKYADPAKIGEYVERLDPFQRQQHTPQDRASPWFHKLVKYQLYLQEGLVELASKLGMADPLILKGKGDIPNNKDPDRNPVIAESDISKWAMKNRARLRRYDLGEAYVDHSLGKFEAAMAARPAHASEHLHHHHLRLSAHPHLVPTFVHVSPAPFRPQSVPGDGDDGLPVAAIR